MWVVLIDEGLCWRVFQTGIQKFLPESLDVQELEFFSESISLSREDSPVFCERMEEGARVSQKLVDFRLAFQDNLSQLPA